MKTYRNLLFVFFILITTEVSAKLRRIILQDTIPGDSLVHRNGRIIVQLTMFHFTRGITDSMLKMECSSYSSVTSYLYK